MGDVTPDYQVEQQRLVARIADLDVRIERHKLEIMETESRRRAAIKNIIGCEIAIKEAKQNLAALKKEHGEPEIDWEAVKREVDDG